MYLNHRVIYEHNHDKEQYMNNLHQELATNFLVPTSQLCGELLQNTKKISRIIVEVKKVATYFKGFMKQDNQRHLSHSSKGYRISLG